MLALESDSNWLHGQAAGNCLNCKLADLEMDDCWEEGTEVVCVHSSVHSSVASLLYSCSWVDCWVLSLSIFDFMTNMSGAQAPKSEASFEAEKKLQLKSEAASLDNKIP